MTTTLASLSAARTFSEMSTTSTLVNHHELLINPYPELLMTIAMIPSPIASTTDGTCTVTLTHPGTTDQYLAFKVKTRQPRKYVVKPNQGLLAPHTSGEVVITMVEQEKKRFLQHHNPMARPPALKNVFLIESYAVPQELSASFVQFKEMQNHDKMKNVLTSMWKSVSGTKHVVHQKLRVRHKVVVAEEIDHIEQAVRSLDDSIDLHNNSDQEQIPASVELPRKCHHETSMGDMSVASSHQVSPAKRQWTRRLFPFRMFHRRHARHDDSKSWTSVSDKDPASPVAATLKLSTELSSLQQKYDQLVTFSEQLQIERDMLKSKLEQSQNDLMREKGLVV